MAEANALDLESTIKELPGVLGCVILTGADGSPAEVQAFTRMGTDRDEVHDLIQEEVARRELAPLRQVLVFELEAESHFGDRESLGLAASLAEHEARSRGPLIDFTRPRPEGGASQVAHRPPILRVSLSTTSRRSQAEVALGGATGEVVGQAAGTKTAHSLRLLAEATLEAAGRMVEADLDLTGASLVSTFGREAVLVVVEVDGRDEVVGAALVRESSVTDAAVRATLDAVNRRIELTEEDATPVE